MNSSSSSVSFFDLAIIGHFARDVIVDRDSRAWSSGGSVYYGSIAARRLGRSVAVITRLAKKDFPFLDELRQEGVKVFATESAETTGFENIYTTENRNRRALFPLGFAGPFTLEELPCLSASYVVLGPIIAGEFDLDFLKEVSSYISGKIALDIQGLIRVRIREKEIVFRNWDGREEGLPFVEVLKTDDVELEVITRKTDLREGAKQLAALGPKEVLVTHAQGLLVLANGKFYRAPFVAKSLRGRTGRGDTAFASYLSWRISSDPAKSCRLAGAVTSIKMERPGPLRASLSEIEQFMQNYPPK